MRGRVIQVTKAAVGGFVLIFLVGISVISVISLAALVANVSALDIGIGPLPLMSFRNSSAGTASSRSGASGRWRTLARWLAPCSRFGGS
jgi:hypothetical protein